MLSNSKKLIAVIGATGHQGGAVVRTLQAGGQFKVRALTRNPDKHRALAEEVVEADLNRPETLAAAFKGAYGVFLVTTSSLEGTDERKQGTAAVKAASDAGVKHVVWSTLPDVEAISGSKFHVGSDSSDRIALANSQAPDQVFDVDSTECPSPEPLNATIHSMRNEIMKTLLTVFKTNDSFTSMMARLTLGLVMFLHGAQKVLGWFGGYGFSATMNFFTEQLRIPALFAFLAMAAEFAGSIGLIAGFLSRVSAFGIAVTMLVAAFMV